MPGTATDPVQAALDGSADPDTLSKAWESADGETRTKLAKSASAGSVERVGFEARVEGSVGALFKNDDNYVIWGPASVEVVDKENDRIKASALEEALPQLMKRQSLSYEHSDQIVGEILDKFSTGEDVEVSFGDTTTKRQDFPTDVLELDGMDAPALFVAGNVYNDTQKAQDVRESIDKGDIDSYSISGEAIVSSMSIEGGEPVTDISKLDLSAVTLCENGMNQMAKFDVVKKSLSAKGQATRLAFAKAEGSDDTDEPLTQDDAAAVLSKTMSNGLTEEQMQKLLDKNLPDEDIATKSDVEEIAREQAEQVLKENATNTEDETEGTPDRPSGDDSNPVEQDNEYSGDADENPADDSDKVEEKSFEAKMKETLKSRLPDDQYKAVEPLLDEEVEEVEPEPEPEEEATDMPEEPAPEPDADDGPDEDLDEAVKSAGLDPDQFTDEQKQEIAKAQVSSVEKAAGVGGVAGEDTDPAFEADSDDIEKAVEKADGTTMAGSNFFGSDGEVNL